MVFMVTCRLSCTHHNTTFGYLKSRIMSFCRTPKVSSEEGRFLGVLSIVSACLLYLGVCTPKHNNDQLWYLTLRSVSSLNNPQNNEVDMLKIIIIIIGLHSEWFHYSCDDIVIDHGKFKIFKLKKRINFLKKKIFVLSMWKLTLGYGNGKTKGWKSTWMTFPQSFQK
jgi:hypothetical protein